MSAHARMVYSVEQIPLGVSLEARLNERAKENWEVKTVIPNTNGYEVVFQKFTADIPTWDRIACEPEMG